MSPPTHRPAASRSVPTLLALGLAALVGCGTTPPSQFYVLSPIDGPQGGAAPADFAVVLEPVRVPPVVDRPQIVTVEGRHERGLSEYSRWAEPLADNLAAVLAENLTRRLGTERVSVLPVRLAEHPDISIDVDIVQFDATLGGTCTLLSVWSLRDGEGAWIDAGRTSCETATAGDGYAALAEAMSRCVAELSDVLAAEILLRAGRG